MDRECKWHLAAVAWCLSVGPAVGASAALDAYGNLPSIEQVALSPNGAMLAFVQTAQDRRMLAIVNVNDSSLIDAVRVGDVKLRAMEWADDQHLLLTTASSQMPMGLWGERTEWHLMAVYDLKSRKLKGLLNNVHSDAHTMNVVIGRPVILHKGNDTQLYLHGLYVSDTTEVALFRVDLTTGIERLVKQGDRKTNEWVVDDSGEIVADSEYDESDKRWAIRLYEGGHPRQTVSGTAAIDSPDILGLSAKGDALIVALTEADGVAWKPLSIADGAWGSDLSTDEPLSELLRPVGSQRMIGTGFIGDAAKYHFVDAALQAGWEWTERVFGFQRVIFVGICADHSKFLVEVMGPKSGYGYFLSDVREHIALRVGKIYEGVTDIAEVRPITYPAGDGLQIPAYLTLPPGREARNLAVVVFPHGGPEARDTLQFDWFAQALAAQGYAVLQPNYRGSELGRKWVEAGYGEWGRKMQTDLSDGLAYLVSQGIADPRRACIVGASYGGYAAMAGVSLQSGIYRCAVAVAGVSDPTNFMRWVLRKEAYGDRQGLRYWERFLGVKDPGDKSLDGISPLKHVDAITVPLLLIHGRDDTTVPYDQSADVAKAMKRAGKPVTFVTLDKEDHYLSRSATRMQTLQAAVDFLKRYNPPD